MIEIRTVSPLDLLKNPMILIAVVGLGFVFGMPYLMDNSMFNVSLPCLCPSTATTTTTTTTTMRMIHNDDNDNNG